MTSSRRPEAFLTEAFGASPPQQKFLDLDAGAQAQLGAVLGHPYPQARLRDWTANGRTAWIFDDKGKEGYVPTTAGFVIEKGGTIGMVRVLIYRESHGEEVSQPLVREAVLRCSRRRHPARPQHRRHFRRHTVGENDAAHGARLHRNGLAGAQKLRRQRSLAKSPALPGFSFGLDRIRYFGTLVT